MKRFLFSLVAILITSTCFAQDVIVKKDGTTIQTKVIKVGKSEVEYKRFDNQSGPTYTISTTELQCINYENGTKDTFVSPNYDPTIATNETATQYSNDKELIAIYNNLNKKEKAPKEVKEKTPKVKKIVTPEMRYKRGKRMKVAGYVVGGTFLAAGVASIIIGVSQDKYRYENLYANNNNIRDYKYANDRSSYFIVGGMAIAGGAAIGLPLIMKGSSLQKKYGQQIQTMSAISQDINFKNGSSLNLGIDVLSDNHSNITAPGIGVRFNF